MKNRGIASVSVKVSGIFNRKSCGKRNRRALEKPTGKEKDTYRKNSFRDNAVLAFPVLQASFCSILYQRKKTLRMKFPVLNLCKIFVEGNTASKDSVSTPVLQGW